MQQQLSLLQALKTHSTNAKKPSSMPRLAQGLVQQQAAQAQQ